MSQDPPDCVRAPSEGQRFVDALGKHWYVNAVVQSPGAEGYYIVRVSHGSTPECTDGVSLLGRGEFSALCREKSLLAMAPEAIR